MADPLVEYMLQEGRQDVGRVPTARRAERLRTCARWLEFRKFYTLPDQPIKLAKVYTCAQPHLCGFCAIQRSVRLLKFWHPRIMTRLERGVRPYLVTLTAKGGPDVGVQFWSMTNWLQKWWKQGIDGRRPGRRMRAISWALGAIFSVEVKRGEGTRGGGWHVHAHGVVLMGSELDQAWLASDWCEVTGQSDPRAQDVRLLESFTKFDAHDLAEAQMSESVGHDLCEVFKYPMKFGELAVADRWQAYAKLYGRRFLRAMGNLKGVEPDPAYLDAELQVDDLPYFKMVLRYSGGRYAVERSEFC